MSDTPNGLPLIPFPKVTMTRDMLNKAHDAALDLFPPSVMWEDLTGLTWHGWVLPKSMYPEYYPEESLEDEQ